MDKKKRFTLDKMTFLLFTIIPLVLYTFFYIISVVSGCLIYTSILDTTLIVTYDMAASEAQNLNYGNPVSYTHLLTLLLEKIPILRHMVTG